MINGHLLEAKQGFALLEDVDQDTFVRFIHWTYTGDYSAPEHTWAEIEGGKEDSSTEAAQKETSVPNDFSSWGHPPKVSKKKKKSSSRLHTTLKESFVSGYLPWSLESSGPRGNLNSQEDYTEVFLAHARLYVFAEKYDIQDLKSLCRQKLGQTLGLYTLYPERVEDITSLLKYVYANTNETVDGSEDIRTILAHCVGTEMATLNKYGEIKDLMLDNGDVLDDFLKMFALNIS